ncbi:hypothetical protein MMC20_002656 [Loxospora ochrophaea]|nr:hypothetical protein [Loxospora ochrophaea]
MADARSRSRSPPARHEDRQRSRSPRQRQEDRPKKSSGGFRWKEKRRDEEGRDDDGKRLERGYRERDRERPRSPIRTDNLQQPDGDKAGEVPKKQKKEKKPKVSVSTGEPMIIVNVNDRLGTKASIPCLASDPIKLFKAQVAARIGREPHEIMLKRQGERPFKDHLTLEDYGVSNGVQLDLEVDTGD